MNTNIYIVNYLAEANLGLLLLYGMYWLFLRRETNFRFKRAYLVASIVLSLTFPLVDAGERNEAIPSISQALPTYWLPEVVIGDEPVDKATADTSFVLWQVVPWLYLGGVACSLALLICQLIRLRTVIRRAAVRTQIGRYKVIETMLPLPACSFFHYIILGATHTLAEEDKKQIIRHEIVHAQKLHSLDVLLVELARIVFWFNPVVHILKKAISDVHEFQADEKAVKDQDVQTYCSLLARITLQSAGFSFANHFNRSITLKRIVMMKTIKTKMKAWKIAVITPVAAALFVAIACQEQVMEDLDTIVQNSSAALNIPADVQAKYEELQKAKPDSKYIVMELNKEGKQKLDEMEKQYGLPKSIHVFKVGEKRYEETGEASMIGEASEIHIRESDRDDPQQTFAIIEYNDQTDALARQTAEQAGSGEEIFMIVEETAHPREGMEAFYQFVSSNMKYPAEAAEKGVSGRVFIEFVVEKDGTLTNFKALKGIGAGCDEEAMRVLAMAPAWSPGMQRGKAVRQKMVLPVMFNAGAAVQPERVSSVNKKMNVKIETIDMVDGKPTVTGYVHDDEGNALTGASIVVKGTTSGTVVDQNGRFRIMLADKDQKLVFSFVGYDTHTHSF